jgi:CCR4-NOT complex subunit CAF16
VKDVNDERREYLIKLLDIDLNWSMMRTSDGQRRRVQIAMGLLREYKVLLMDEITVDLDILSRLDLMEFFRQECEVRQNYCCYTCVTLYPAVELVLLHLYHIRPCC